MSYVLFNNPLPRRGRPKDARLHLIALEYLMTPAPRPNGLQKQMAHVNGIALATLSQTCTRIKRRIKENP